MTTDARHDRSRGSDGSSAGGARPPFLPVRDVLHDLVEAGAADVLRELRAALADAECAISVRAQAARLESPDNRYAAEVHQLRCLAEVYVAEMDARLGRLAVDATAPSQALGDILEAYARAGDRQRMRTIASAVSDAYDAASSVAWAIGDEDRTHAEQALASMRRRLSTLRVAPAGTDAPALAEGSSRATVAGTPAGGGTTSSASLPIHVPAMYRTFALCGAVQEVDEVLDSALVTPTCPTCMVRAEAGWLPDAETCERWLARAEAGLVECGGGEDTGSFRVSRDMGEF